MASSGYKNFQATEYDQIRFEWETTAQSVANNTSVIAWKLLLVAGDPGRIGSTVAKLWSVTVDGEEYSGVNYIGIENNSTKTLASGTKTIQHTADGSKTFSFSFSQQFRVNFGGVFIDTITGSGTGTLNRIARESSLTASNGTLGVAQTLTITEKDSSFLHRLTYRCGDVAEYIAGSASTFTGSTVISWTPRIGLAAENTTGTTVQVTLTLYTYNSNGVHLGTTQKTITCTIPSSVKPSCSIDLTDATGWMTTYGKPVQGVSKIKVKVTPQTSQGSPIASYSVDAAGVKYTTAEATTEVLTASGAFKVNATVKDQRGRSGSATATLDVLAYTKPQVTALSVHRCDEDGTENDQGEFVKAVFSAKVTNLASKNPATYTLRYKESTEEGYTLVEFDELDGVYTVTNKAYVFPADSNASYDVEVTATDNHGTATRATSASTAFTLLNWHESGTGMGVGKVSEKENAVEFALDLYDKKGHKIYGVGGIINLILPVGSIVLRYDTRDPNTLYPGTTWTQITARVLRAGSAGSIGTEGTIADGSGRTYIDVAVWRRTK